jgi:hypothetical protein
MSDYIERALDAGSQRFQHEGTLPPLAECEHLVDDAHDLARLVFALCALYELDPGNQQLTLALMRAFIIGGRAQAFFDIDHPAVPGELAA